MPEPRSRQARAAYNYPDYTQDLIEILDAEGIDKVISVGHDWGSLLAQRLYNHHPDRVEGLVLINVGYMPPSADAIDINAANDQLEKIFGYPLLAYQAFFISDEAPAILNSNAGRVFDALHGAPENWMRDIFCVRGAMRKWLLGNTEVELRPYAQDPRLKDAFIQRFQQDGFDGPLCYYRAINQHKAQQEGVERLANDAAVVKVPTLYIICKQDFVCRPEVTYRAKQAGLLPDFEEATLDRAHWSPMESPGEIASLIKSFLERKFGS
ncbi:Alpha/Beta hydrolase protein [Xylariaceae sp. FL0016]|nr:Alpha/Beta hydrolase protein [Xylariaceae sp. FL0016]